MCTNFLITFVVSAIEGIAGGVLQNYRLNDMKYKRKTSTAQSNEDDPASLLSPEWSYHFKKRALEDFGDNDQIYEEFCSTSDSVDDELPLDKKASFNWRKYRPKIFPWLVICILHTFSVVVLCGFLVGMLTTIIMLIDINTANACYKTKWHEVPINVQRVRVLFEVLEGWMLQFLYIILLIFVFGFKLVDKLHLINLNIISAFIDSVYRLCFQIYDIYDWPCLSYPLNALSLSVIITMSYILAGNFTTQVRQRIIITFQLGLQFILGLITLYITVYKLVPWFIRLTLSQQAIVASIMPLCGEIIKAVSRIAIQNISGINHPGTSYILAVGVYAGTTILYRTLQAEIDSLRYFILLSVVHALIGLVEKLSVVLRDHFYIWFYKRILKKQINLYSFVGLFRTPRTQRLIADLVICNVIHEVAALMYTNALIQLYALQVGLGSANTKVDKYEVLGEYLTRISVAVFSEFVITVFGIFILTWYMNIPVVRVWKKEWRNFLKVNLFICSLMAIYITHYMAGVVAGKYEVPKGNVTHPCHEADLLFFH